jgi:hypothetical protein
MGDRRFATRRGRMSYSDKIAIWTGSDADNLIARRTSGVSYWEGEHGRQK